jgi:hypothetical protein
MAGHQRTADTPAGGGRADTPAGGGRADKGGALCYILRMGIHAYAMGMGEGRTRREPQRGGRERCINTEITEIKPGKHSDTRITPLPLANGHGRYITVTPEHKLLSVGEWPLHDI